MRVSIYDLKMREKHCAVAFKLSMLHYLAFDTKEKCGKQDRELEDTLCTKNHRTTGSHSLMDFDMELPWSLL